MSAVRRGFVLFAVGISLVLVLSGCGGGTSKVRGKVTHKGKPVVWGTVTLVGQDGIYRDGDIDLNGNYEIADVPTGPVKIAVNSPNPDTDRGRGGGRGVKGGGGKAVKGGGAKDALPDPRGEFLDGKEKAADERPKPPPGAWFALPAQAGDPQTSGLTGDVKGSETVIDIEVK